MDGLVGSCVCGGCCSGCAIGCIIGCATVWGGVIWCKIGFIIGSRIGFNGCGICIGIKYV